MAASGTTGREIENPLPVNRRIACVALIGPNVRIFVYLSVRLRARDLTLNYFLLTHSTEWFAVHEDIQRGCLCITESSR